MMSKAAPLLDSQSYPARDPHDVAQAFALFNQVSAQLNESYRLLESRVSELKGELAQVSEERLRQLAEKERLANRLEHLLEVLPGGVIVIDGQGVVAEANPAAVALLGPPLVGQQWREVIGRCFAPAAMTVMRFRSRMAVACPSPPVPWAPSPASWCCLRT